MCCLRASSGTRASVFSLGCVVTSDRMELADSLHYVCPQTFSYTGFPIFTEDGLAFWCTRFAHKAWENGWHTEVGTDLGRRLAMHPCHVQWRNRAFHWAQKPQRQQNRPVETFWMARLRRVPCNMRRYGHLGPNQLLMTQWGDCALRVTLYNNIPMAEAAGYPLVKHHCKQAVDNRMLCCAWQHLGLEFQLCSTHYIGDVIEMYVFQMMESACGGDVASAENLFFVAMYALFLQYCPWHAPR